ncbi:hypothetical protein CHS0354_006038 [Potamilus streckersoni]|uniref:Uncharacterized protein n=1 Tax=Potamilus streckersoni TaxID=2493646 RepID=A0AAE0VNK6_9BIVA|nr:hypothetical protein CHS0354_006038 [Potamilus streckersoni]
MEEENASLEQSNNGQVTMITAEVHAESEEEVKINPIEGNAADTISQLDSHDYSVASPDHSSHTKPINPDRTLGNFRGKTSFDVWGNPHSPESKEKNVKLSGTGAKLIKAAKTCDYKSMKNLLDEQKDLDLDCTDETGQAAIHYAASKGHIEILQLLVENGAKLDLRDKQKGKTALHLAVSMNQVKAIEYLVCSGASMTVKDREGNLAEQFSKDEKMEITLSNMRAVTNAGNEVTEIRLEANKVDEGSKTPFKKLGLVVEYSNNGKKDFFIMMCKQSTTENSNINFGFQKKEEVVSDVFVYRIYCNKGSLPSIVTVPLFSGPEQRTEVVIKTNNGNELVATDVKEKMKANALDRVKIRRFTNKGINTLYLKNIIL